MLDLRNCDNMDLMREYPDKYFELAIVDPPYGINAANQSFGFSNRSKMEKKGWDVAPNTEYFRELVRVSRNQIIWGGNYFVLPPSRGFVVWDKGPSFKDRDFAECEIAWLSYDSNAKICLYNPLANGDYKARIHPTQKPVALYKWLLKNYANPGDKILDTHLGSMSIAIACLEMGYDLTGCELDKDYFAAGMKRIAQYQAQTKLNLTA